MISDGRRRLWRHRAAGGTAAFAAVAALGLVAPSVVDGVSDGDGGTAVADSAGLEGATYSIRSTIHDRGTEIDVSPHIIDSFVRTDDGFVFVSGPDVYFTDGERIEQIGDGNRSGYLVADDTGSYVGWTDEAPIPDPPEYVVYDTSTGSEVLRGIDEDGGPSGFGQHTTYVADIDGDLAYVNDAHGVVAWDLTDGTSSRIASTKDPRWLWGVSDGTIAHREWEGNPHPAYVVASEDPQADRPRVPTEGLPVGAVLSPTGKYVVTYPPGTGRDALVVTETSTGRDVTPDGVRYLPGLAPMEWVDDDSFYVAWAPPGTDYHTWMPAGAEKPDLARCWISTGQCEVVAEELARSYELRGPNGQIEPLR